MSSMFGESLRVSIFGESHGPAVGAVIDGLPAGFRVDMDLVAAEMARRAPGGALATSRREPDEIKILSGITDGATNGAPLAAIIENTDRRSGDYSELRKKPRPMHADFPAAIKYGGANDIRGGGHFSARLTAPLCFAGAVAAQILYSRDIFIGAHIAHVHGIYDDPFDPVAVGPDMFRVIRAKNIPIINDDAAKIITREIEEARAAGDSLGGVIECAVVNIPPGIGEPLYGNMESKISSVIFGIPAVKGIEFGAGFAAAGMRGSEHNDEFYFDGEKIKTRTNRHGGILGGITTGMPLIFRAAFKPTPSIAREQNTVDLEKKINARLSIKGRHDPCVVLRATPCVEAAAALATLDMMLVTNDHFSRGR